MMRFAEKNRGKNLNKEIYLIKKFKTLNPFMTNYF